MFNVIRTCINATHMYKTFKKEGSIYFNDNVHGMREITDKKEIKNIIKTVITKNIKHNLLKIKGGRK